MTKNLVIYTVLTGSKEELQNPFPENSHGYERICFTDNPNLKSQDWTIVLMDNHYLGAERESRLPKLLPHRFLSDFQWSLYIDNTINLTTDPQEIWKHYSQKESSLICFKHPWRDCIYDEGEIIIACEYDDETRVREQLDFYRSQGFPSHSGLIAGTMLLRNHLDSKVIEIQEEWFNHVLRYSKRDQLSFPFIAWQKNFKYDYFEGSLTENKLMEWLKNLVPRVPRDFKENIYLWLNPEVQSSGMSPQEHYLKIGIHKKLPYRTYHWNLNRLANKYKSDKGTVYYNRHGYAAIYEKYLHQSKNTKINLLEIGLLRHDLQARNPDGPYDDIPSLKMWREYFSQAKIIGFDINDFSASPPLNNVKIIRGDMSKKTDLDLLIPECPEGFDVIIDDASHASHHQQIALGYLFKHLKPGGLYFIEDLHYQPQSLEIKGIIKTMTILKALTKGTLIETNFLDQNILTYLQENIEFINFYDSQDRQFGQIYNDALAVIKKKNNSNKKKNQEKIYLIVDIQPQLEPEIISKQLSTLLVKILEHPQGQLFYIIVTCSDEEYLLIEEIILEVSLEIFMETKSTSFTPDINLLTRDDLSKNQQLLNLITGQILIELTEFSELFWQNIQTINIDELLNINFQFIGQ